MLRPALALAVALMTTLPVLALDAESEVVVDGAKIGKRLPIEDVAALMRGAERWCYDQTDSTCAWSDIYLDVGAEQAVFEITNPWNAAVDISFTEQGEFREGRYICETRFDWIETVRAFDRDDGVALGGRDLFALKEEIRASVSLEDRDNCYDYVFRGSDSAADTVTLLQRQWQDGVTDPAQDAVVTVHFDADTARSLSWYF
jgi:hypothetical protein